MPPSYRGGADRNAARTPLNGPQAAERGSGRVATAETGVNAPAPSRPAQRRWGAARRPLRTVRITSHAAGGVGEQVRCDGGMKISRTCRGGRGRGRCAGRGASSAPLGPTTLIRFTTSLPTAAASRVSSWRCSVRSCVAHAVDSACSTSSPSRSDTGVQWSAISAPTRCGHRPSTVASVSRGDQPRSNETRATRRPNSCGSRSSGPGPTSADDAPRAGALAPAHLGRSLGRLLRGGVARGP